LIYLASHGLIFNSSDSENIWYLWIPESILIAWIAQCSACNFSGSEKKLQELEPGSQSRRPAAEVRAECLPAHKAALVSELQAMKKRVAWSGCSKLQMELNHGGLEGHVPFYMGEL